MEELHELIQIQNGLIYLTTCDGSLITRRISDLWAIRIDDEVVWQA